MSHDLTYLNRSRFFKNVKGTNRERVNAKQLNSEGLVFLIGSFPIEPAFVASALYRRGTSVGRQRRIGDALP